MEPTPEFAANGASQPTANSKAKEYLSKAWKGVVFVNTVASLLPLDGIPFNSVPKMLNFFVELVEAVSDKRQQMDALVERLAEQIKVVSEASEQAVSEDAKERIEGFYSTLVQSSYELGKLKGKKLWVEVFDREDDVRIIEAKIQEMEASFQTFQIRVMLSIERDIGSVKNDLDGIKLDLWPRVNSARYSVSQTRHECTPDTRVDILRSISDWATCTSPDSPAVYWLCGNGGTGKSTIVQTIAGMLDDEEEKEHPRLLAATYFCSRQIDETRNRFNVIPTISYQLARCIRSYARALLANPEVVDLATASNLKQQIRKLLIEPWRKSAKQRGGLLTSYVIVIDALDEIGNQGGAVLLGELLSAIQDGKLQGLKFLVTSRADPQLLDQWNSFSLGTMFRLDDVKLDNVQKDIETFVRASLPALKDSPRIDDIVHQAKGVFIFAATVVRYVKPGVRTPSEQRRALDRLILNGMTPGAGEGPSMIEELYQQILASAFTELSTEDIPDRLKILHAILCSAEPISVSSVTELCAVDVDIVQALADSLHAALYVSASDGRIYWYHSTFQEFFFNEPRASISIPGNNSPVSVFCNKLSIHSYLSECCLKTLQAQLHFNICHLPSSFLFDEEVPDIERLTRDRITETLRYSSRHWGWHLEQSNDDSSGSLEAFFVKFIYEKLLYWIEAMNLIHSKNRCASQIQYSRRWLQRQANEKDYTLHLAYLADAERFVAFFCGMQASDSTPHLYLSSLATWGAESPFSMIWRPRFRIPLLRSQGIRNDLLISRIVGSPIRSVGFSSDGKYLVSGSVDQMVRVWDVQTMEELKCFVGHSDTVNCVAFSADAKLIVSGSEDYTIRIWDLSGEVVKVKTLAGHTDAVVSVAFFTYSNRLFVVSGSNDKTVKIWDVLSGEVTKSFAGHTAWITSVASPGTGNYVVSGSDDSTVKIWDISSGEEVRCLLGHEDSVKSVAFSTDGRHVLSGSDDKTVRLWEAESGEELRRFIGHTDYIRFAAFSPNGKYALSGSDDFTVRVWSVENGREMKRLIGHATAVYSVAASADGRYIASGAQDRTIRIWDASGMEDIDAPSLIGHAGFVYSAGVSRDGRYIVSGAGDRNIQLWDAKNGEEVATFSGHMKDVRSVAFSGDGKYIASGSEDQTVCLWDVSNGEAKKRIGHTDWIESVAISADGKYIVSCSDDKTVRVWGTVNGEVKRIIEHDDYVRSAAFSANGDCIVTGCDDKMVRAWAVSSGEELKRFEGHTGWVTSVASSADGNHIVSGSRDRTARVREVSTEEMKVTVRHRGPVYTVAFSPRGDLIASGSGDKTICVWNASTGDKIRSFTGHTSPVRSVAFSPDGGYVVSGSEDQTVRVWKVSNVPVEEGNPIWRINRRGWLVTRDALHSKLMIVPFRPHIVFDPRTTRFLISRDGSVSIDFAGCTFGPGWETCYIDRTSVEE